PTRLRHALPTRRSSDLIQQGGQVILHYGKLYNVTAEFYPAIDGPPGAPVNNIAFGFGGPGTIGYSDTNGQYGAGAFLLNPISSRSEEHTSELQSRFDLV